MRPLARFFLLVTALATFPYFADAGGTWVALATSPPTGVNNCILLSDGTVLGMDGAADCVKLIPDIHGSYLNGTWIQLASMNNSRLFYSSQLLTNGNLWVAGGEDGTGGAHSELYFPLSNVWTKIPDPNPDPSFSDSISKLLPNGNPLVAPVSEFGGCLIYNVASNSWQTAASCNRGSQDEAAWVKLPSDCILTIDAFSQNSEHYVPSLNEWVNDGGLPMPLYDSALGELGTGHLLPNGKVFWMGSTTNTAIYTPGATVTSAGSWVAGPVMVFGTTQLGQSDAPAAMMVNGKILCCLGPSATYNGPSSFYEYDYTSNTFTQMTAPGGGSTLGNTAPFGTSMLDLPDGTVLFMDGQNAGALYIYTPDGTPLAAGQPVINSITQNLDGSYHLTGTGLDGISEGAAYGDDEQMNSNYPLVRMTNNATGNVYYACTYNWSSTSVQTSNRVLTTEFSLPANFPAGTYSLVVTANGNASAAVLLTNAPLAAPNGLTGIAGNAQAILSWNAVSGATAYNLMRLTTSGTPYYATVATVMGTSFTNVGLVNAYDYSYVVTTVSPGGESTNSPTLMLTASGPPPVPTGVTAASATFARIYLSWNPSYGASSYNISRASTFNGPYTNLASSINPFYTDSGLLNGAAYYYIVSAASAEGQSGNSAPVSAIAQAVVDFGFEVPNIGSGNYVYTPTEAFWNFSGTNTGFGSGLIANGSGFSNPNAAEGVQAAFVQSNGFVSQVLAGFTPGSNYTLTFSATERPGNAQTWNVTMNGTVIASYNPGSGATSYSNYTAAFTATAPTETLAFVGTDLAGGDNTVFIDDVQIVLTEFVNVPDFSFETPVVSDHQYNPSGAPWTFTGASPNGSGIIANGSAFSNPNAPQGAQAAFVQESGSIRQSISGLTSGTIYQITFAAAERPGNAQTWNVTMNGGVIASYNPGSSATSYGNYTANFKATAATETLAFVGIDFATGDNTIFIDDVTIAPPLQPVTPLVTLTAPTNGTTFIGIPVISMAANVVSNGNVINSVQFYDGSSNLIGQAASQPYSCSWTNPNTGTHGVFAQVTYNGGSVADSSAAIITIINTNVNFGFETPGIGSGNFQYDPTGASWTFGGSPGSGSGLVANGSGFSNPNAPQGAQAAFVQSYGSISQILYGFTQGTNYTVTFSAAQRPGGSQHGGESWNVMIDNNAIGSYNPGPGATSYATYTATFAASAASHTLAFVGTDLATGDNTVFIDNVIINPHISQTPPSILLTSPAPNAVFSAANPVNLAASVTTNGNTIVGVQFYSNTTNFIAQVPAPYACAWSNASAGVSSIFARLVFNGSNTLDSGSVNVTVTNPPPVMGAIGWDANDQNLTIAGTGLSSRPYFLSATTNLAPPVVWRQIQTNLSDAAGNILFSNIAPTNTQQFFRISAP